jgi:hypothetical protein
LTARPSQSAAKASATIAWFDRYRGGTDHGGQRSAATARTP